MRVVKILFACHLAALAIGLGDLLIELWETPASAGSTVPFVLRNAGTLPILFGAATMLLFGLICVGTRKTLIFFAASTLISLRMELLGAGTAFPDGASSSAPVPGFEVASLAPYSSALSWFYMGFASYLLASKLTSRLRLRRQTLWSLILGTYFLMTWKLALDGVIASEYPTPHYSLWHAYSSSFGMPVSNLGGWALNGLIFMGVSRLLWRSKLDMRRLATWLPFGVYTVNTGFVMALDLGAGLWFPLFLSALFVLLPESLAFYPKEEMHGTRAGPGRATLSQSVWLVMRVGSHFITRRHLEMHAEGVEHIPQSGPVLIAARHFHYFYDGFILLRSIPRRMHTMVALDWLQSGRLRLVIEFACMLADWPVILRGEQMHEHEGDERRAYTPIEARQYLRNVTVDAVRLFRSGELLVIFPEGYPNIDPHPTPKADLDAFLAFRSGFVKMAEQAERDGRTQVAIIPAGLIYTRERGKGWHATVRFGPALFLSDFASAEQLRRAVEARVHALSSALPPPATSSHTPGETFPL
jgi:uncharacterized membrane protein/1-acyl-sn-glycerol-3-phosphate acyltransferase